MDKNNKIKIYTTSGGAELNISAPSVKQVVSATNNRAQFFAEQAKAYRDEAKEFMNNAKYYAEKNSDVSFEYINNVKVGLENKISQKQDIGDYALRTEIPVALSELENDSNYVNEIDLVVAIDDVKLPSQENNGGGFLMTNGETEQWVGITAFQFFDTKITDYKLSNEELLGWALQGTYIYKEALVGSRYGYPDFYNKVIEEYNEATNTEIVNGVTVKVNSNGHKFYDIADKNVIDEFFNTTGIAWFYGIDTENERIFLPRDKYFAVKGDVSVAGNGLSLGLINSKGEFTLFGAGDANAYAMPCDGLGQPYGTGATAITTVRGRETWGINPDSTKSGIEGQLTANQDKYLYICVGNTTNYEGMTDVVNQGMEILEQVNQGIESRVKLDGSNAEFTFITETYQNGNSWYRVYSDGWCEQGGRIAVATATTTISLLKTFKNTDYNLSMTGSAGYPFITSRTVDSFVADTSLNATVNWQACGYIA